MTDKMDGVFNLVDTDNDGIVNEYDLRAYADRSGINADKFVNKWMNLFDEDHDRIIHETDFRRILGMNPKTEVVSPISAKGQYSSGPQRPEILRSLGNLTSPQEDNLSREFGQQMGTTSSARSASEAMRQENVQEMKDRLNRTIKPYWHSQVFPHNDATSTPGAVNRFIESIHYDEQGLVHMRSGQPERRSDQGADVVLWRTNTKSAWPLILRKDKWPNTVRAQNQINQISSHITNNFGDRISPNMNVWEVENSLNKNDSFTPHWNAKVVKSRNPEEANRVACDDEGLLYLRYVEQNTDLMVWRSSAQQGKSSLFCCCC